MARDPLDIFADLSNPRAKAIVNAYVENAKGDHDVKITPRRLTRSGRLNRRYFAGWVTPLARFLREQDPRLSMEDAKDEAHEEIVRAVLGTERVQGLRVVETRLLADGRGRARPEPIAGSEETLRADVVIVAFGFRPSPPDWCAAAGIELDESGRLLVGGAGRLPFQTTNPRVFAGGDNVRGADLVVRAVHDGREAAASMVEAFATERAAADGVPA